MLESEWDRKLGKRQYDFDKLLLGRAWLKVMVFKTEDGRRTEEVLIDFKQRIGAIGGTEKMGDRYLLAAWQDEPKAKVFHFFRLVVSEQLELLPLPSCRDV